MLISPLNSPSTKIPNPYPEPRCRSLSLALHLEVNATLSFVISGAPLGLLGSHLVNHSLFAFRTSDHCVKSSATNGRSMIRRPFSKLLWDIAAGRKRETFILLSFF